MKRLSVSAVFFLLALTLAPPARAADPVGEILKSGKLQQAYNPVLLNFLLDEGQGTLTKAQRKQAIDQLVSSLKADLEVTKGEQVTASLTQAAGLLLGGDVGRTMATTTSSIYNDWVDSAVVMMRAGYKSDATAFFTHCARQFPGEDVRARCVLGLAEAHPEQAVELLVGMVNGSDPEAKKAALRLLGRLAADAHCPEAQKTAILDVLVEHTKGALNSSYYAAAAQGLVSANDPRALEPLREMTGGLLRGDEEKRIAKRGLLLTYGDQEVAEKIEGSLKGGLMGKPKEEQFWAATTLMEAGQEKGYEWAVKTLKEKGGKGGFLSMKNDEEKDYFGDTLWFLVRHGGDRAREVFKEAIEKGKGKDDRKALLAIGLARIGDDSELERVRQALAEEKWGPAYRWQAAVALAKHGDVSGLPVLQQLATAGKDKKHDIDPEDLRPDVAWALGQIDHADGVPILLGLLGDEHEGTRRAALYALLGMKDPAALGGLRAALGVDYGKTDRGSRNPVLYARIVRHVATAFPTEPGAKAVLEAGRNADLLSVRFLSLLASKKLEL